MIHFECPSCKNVYGVKESYGGRSTTCTKCRTKFVIPTSSTIEAPPGTGEQAPSDSTRLRQSKLPEGGNNNQLLVFGLIVLALYGVFTSVLLGYFFSGDSAEHPVEGAEPEKIVETVEVPVERIVEVEVPVEHIVEVDRELSEAETQAMALGYRILNDTVHARVNGLNDIDGVVVSVYLNPEAVDSGLQNRIVESRVAAILRQQDVPVVFGENLPILDVRVEALRARDGVVLTYTVAIRLLSDTLRFGNGSIVYHPLSIIYIDGAYGYAGEGVFEEHVMSYVENLLETFSNQWHRDNE